MRLQVLVVFALFSCAGSHRAREPSESRRQPEDLAAFLAANERAIAANDQRVLARLDAVCGQHDCRSSRLFWYTDLEAAKVRARREGKPILSLRMLGQLTDPLSCANSRFFRTVLYPDPAVRRLLAERFVLHWKQVRPVPKITIDFGDGRTLKRTLTGNSAHYVLDSDGRPLDVLPGLFDPRAFERALATDLALAAQLARSGARRDGELVAWHRAQLAPLFTRWSRLLEPHSARRKLPADPGSALLALHTTTRGLTYERLAEPASLAYEVESSLQSRFPDAWNANEIAPTKAIVESPVLRALNEIRWSIGRDSIENELWNHGRVHLWFANESVGQLPIDALDRRVYAELFAAPLDDPWYGLMPSEAMRALDDCVEPR